MMKNPENIWRNNRFFTTWRPNIWDFVAMLLVFALLVLCALGAKQMSVPYHLGQTIPIHLEAKYLPSYALNTVIRMLIAMLISLLFTFVVGTLAVKNKHAERVIIPCIDILQSVPVFAYLSLTIAGFIALFPGSMWGPECAVIFMLFTAQVWNMTLGFYQSLRNIPKNLDEAASMFQLSAWQRFWRLEVPFAMPSLIWNFMLSMSASWFFIVGTEAISVNNQTILLPGIGSYIAVANQQTNIAAIFYAIIVMLVVIILYDQLLCRPIVCWADKFKAELTAGEHAPKSWIVTLLLKTRLLFYLGEFVGLLLDAIVNIKFTHVDNRVRLQKPMKQNTKIAFITVWYTFIFLISTLGIFFLLHFIFHDISIKEAGYVFVLGLYTTIRLMVLIVVSSLIWIPVGVWIGMRPNVARYAQPIVQILAAFPANLFFPLFVIFILTYHLNADIWLTPLIILGAQWYILFNVIAGASAIPEDIHAVTRSFGVRGVLWWWRVILPGIFPFYITGAITSAGGAWNASVLAEIVHWGNNTVVAHGLGAYITQYTTTGDFPRVVLGMVIMCIYVLAFNRIIWQPLYNLSQRRFLLD